jgi:hypothetical protein
MKIKRRIEIKKLTVHTSKKKKDKHKAILLHQQKKNKGVGKGTAIYIGLAHMSRFVKG